MFNEAIEFGLEANVPDPKPFEAKLRDMLDSHEEFLRPDQHAIGNRYEALFACMSDGIYYASQ